MDKDLVEETAQLSVSAAPPARSFNLAASEFVPSWLPSPPVVPATPAAPAKPESPKPKGILPTLIRSHR